MVAQNRAPLTDKILAGERISAADARELYGWPLQELGALADPPLTKDAVAGRIRRLLAMADKEAEDRGIPNTEANLTPEMLAEGL